VMFPKMGEEEGSMKSCGFKDVHGLISRLIRASALGIAFPYAGGKMEVLQEIVTDRRHWTTSTGVTSAGDSLSCTSPQILNFFVMTKTLGALMRQRAAAQTLAGLSDHRRNAERGPHLLH